MRFTFTTSLFLGFLIFMFTSGVYASNKSCSFANTNGDWAFSYSGDVILPTGPLRVASVGLFKQTNGSLSGSETRNLVGSVADETITADYTVNADCMASYAFQVFDAGVLVRTSKVNVVFENNGRSVRGIFTSLVLADGPALPNVITVDARKIFPGE
jgi:hypothetical protein